MKTIKKIIHSEGAKITSINSISVIIKIVTGVVTSKFLALFIGPSGLALVGNFRNFSGIVESITSLGLQTGVVKFAAENKDNNAKMTRLLTTLFLLVTITSLICGTGFFLFSDNYNDLIFGKNYHFEIVFKAMIILIPLNVFGTYLASIINGYGNYEQVIKINILGNLISLVLTIVFVYFFGIEGAIFSVTLGSVALFFIALIYLPRSLFAFSSDKLEFDFGILRQLGHYLLMMLVSGVLSQYLQIYIRKLIISRGSMDQAGFWEAINRVSSNYMLFISTLLGVYYYPKLINAISIVQTGKVIKSYYKNIVPLYIVGAIIIFFTKDFLVKLLFTEEFESVSQLFFWQLVGDFFKVVSWILGFQFLAKKMTKEYLIFEFISFGILYLTSIYFIEQFQVKGAVIAFAVTYFCYWLILSVYFRKVLRS